MFSLLVICPETTCYTSQMFVRMHASVWCQHFQGSKTAGPTSMKPDTYILWVCGLEYKPVSEMTCNVSSGMLNSTIPYRWRIKRLGSGILNIGPNLASWSCGDDHVTKGRNRKLIPVTSSNERLKHKCIKLSYYNRYLNQIWYRSQISHCLHAGMVKFTTSKYKMPAAAILDF